jgi:hypothetical protein
MIKKRIFNRHYDSSIMYLVYVNDKYFSAYSRLLQVNLNSGGGL